jgi:hypothetical protein
LLQNGGKEMYHAFSKEMMRKKFLFFQNYSNEIVWNFKFVFYILMMVLQFQLKNPKNNELKHQTTKED